jgi:UDP-N-acetylmuramyl tripeptide synthase
MPLTLRGKASYNTANIAGAALTASALGIAAATIATTLARFGGSASDNPGRLQHWRFGNLQVFVDYAHNPDGLRGLLDAVGADKRTGRLALIRYAREWPDRGVEFRKQLVLMLDGAGE